MAYLDEAGLARVWNKVKELIPTKTSELLNDSEFLQVKGDITSSTDLATLDAGFYKVDNVVNPSFPTGKAYYGGLIVLAGVYKGQILAAGESGVGGLFARRYLTGSARWTEWINCGGGESGCPFPVNGIYMSMDSTNPSTIWTGTTWERMSQGKVLVGVDDASTPDPDFIANKTGGSKGIQAHNHGFTQPTIPAHTHTVGNQSANHTHGTGVSGKTFVVSSETPTEHKVASGTSTSYYYWYTQSDSAASRASNTGNQSANHNHSVTGGGGNSCTGGAVGSVAGLPTGQTTGNSGNLQPYMTCYIWKRVS